MIVVLYGAGLIIFSLMSGIIINHNSQPVWLVGLVLAVFGVGGVAIPEIVRFYGDRSKILKLRKTKESLLSRLNIENILSIFIGVSFLVLGYAVAMIYFGATVPAELILVAVMVLSISSILLFSYSVDLFNEKCWDNIWIKWLRGLLIFTVTVLATVYANREIVNSTGVSSSYFPAGVIFHTFFISLLFWTILIWFVTIILFFTRAE